MSIGLAAAIVAGVVGLVLALELSMRRIAPAEGFWGRPEPNHSGSGLTVIGSAFAILVAFVLFLSFQSFQDAKQSAVHEARATEGMFHTAEPFPVPLRASLHGSLVCYGRAVITQEWEAMEDSREADIVEGWARGLDALGRRVDGRDPIALHALDRFDRDEEVRDEARHDRIAAATPSVPGLLWVALIGGGILLVLYMSTFANPSVRPWLQLWLICTVAAVGTLNLCVIRFLDTPFSGHTGSVEPTAMQESLAVIDEEIAEQYPRTPIPCDRSGLPIEG